MTDGARFLPLGFEQQGYGPDARDRDVKRKRTRGPKPFDCIVCGTAVPTDHDVRCEDCEDRARLRARRYAARVTSHAT